LPQIPIERHRLSNGLRIVLSHDPRTPIVAVNLWYAVGSRHEKPGKTGFAHLFEHMMTQGSAHVAKGEHFALIEAAGGNGNASTGLDRTNYWDTLPSHELELALWLEPKRINAELSRYQAVDAGRLGEAMAASLRPDNRVVLTYLPDQ
jgi:zinc protease